MLIFFLNLKTFGHLKSKIAFELLLFFNVLTSCCVRLQTEPVFVFYWGGGAFAVCAVF